MSQELENVQNEEQQNEEQQDDEQMVKLAEMKRRLAKEEEKHQKELDKLMSEQSQLIEQAVEQARAEAQMSEKELREFKEKEAERKRKEQEENYRKQIDELLSEKKQREIRDESINKLSELNVAVNDKTLDLVSAHSFDAMVDKAEKLAQIINDVKNDFASSEAPLRSGRRQSNSHSESLSEFFRAGNILKNKGE